MNRNIYLSSLHIISSVFFSQSTSKLRLTRFLPIHQRSCVDTDKVMHKIKNDDEFVDGKRQANRLIRPISFPKEELSHTVDLRRWMSPIEEQGDMNTW
jgi:hypothetical protein